MTLLVTMLWPALAAALLLGTGIGWLSGLPNRLTAPLVLAAAIAAAFALNLSGWVPGRGGLFVESAALLLPAYALGCLLGGLAHLAAGRAQG